VDSSSLNVEQQTFMSHECHAPGAALDLVAGRMGLSDAFVVDDTATPERVAQAADLLGRCMGIVMLEPAIVLRPGVREICCQVVDPAPAAHRCEEEYKVLVENAARALDRSKLAALLPDRPLRWAVVEQRGSELFEVWSDRCRRGQ
jgi:hypothetical protein